MTEKRIKGVKRVSSFVLSVKNGMCTIKSPKRPRAVGGTYYRPFMGGQFWIPSLRCVPRASSLYVVHTAVFHGLKAPCLSL